MTYGLTPETTGTGASGRAHGVFSSSRRVALISTFVAVQGWLGLLLIFEWGHGIARGVILGGLLGGLILLRFRPRPASEVVGDSGALLHSLRVFLIFALIVDLGVVSYATIRSVRTRQIPMDQGQSTWRAARLLRRGENPYGVGALVDFTAFQYRTRFRQAAGMESKLPAGAALDAALLRYDENLDPALRREILPVPEGGRLTMAAGREARLVGYKYGPVPMIVTAPFVSLGVPAIVLLLNAIACIGLFAALWQLLKGTGGGPFLTGLGLLALLLDPYIAWNYLDHTATDVWALVFAGLAVLASSSEMPIATGAALALAVGSKIFPSLLFAPLLLRFRSARSVAVFTGLVAAIYLPWLVWDPASLVYNVFLFPILRPKDSTAWLYYAPSRAAIVVQGIGLLFIGVLWLRFLAGRERRLFWTLAVINTILLLVAGSFHDNYLPWASTWVTVAIVEAFAIVKTGRPEGGLPATHPMQPASATGQG
jgi:hypothetical protein